MDKDFYNRALRLMDDIRSLEPTFAGARDAEFCAIQTDQGTIYGGITSVKVIGGHIMTACPEFSAIMTMVPEGESRVTQMITISFAGKTVSQPCETCLQLLLRINQENLRTKVYVSANQAEYAATLLGRELPAEEAAAAPAAETSPDADETAAEAIAAAVVTEEVPAEETVAPEKTVAEEAAFTEEAPEPAPAAPEAAPVSEDVPAFAEEAQSVPIGEEIHAMNETPAAEETAPAPEEAPAEAEAPITPASSGVMTNEEAQDLMAEFTGEVDEDNPIAQFGFEAAEIDTLVADESNPFYDAPIKQNPDDDSLPPYLRQNQPRFMSERPQSQQMPSQQSSMYASQSLPGQGSMYASQPMPGQGGAFQPGQGVFQPGQNRTAGNAGVYQPGQRQQGGTFQPGQQNAFQPGQSQQVYQPGQSQQVYQPGQSQQSVSQQVFQPGQQNPFQPGRSPQAQYASRPAPGSRYLSSQYIDSQQTGSQYQSAAPHGSSSVHSSGYGPSSYTAQNAPKPKGIGSAFKQRLSAFMGDETPGKEAAATEAELRKLAKEKKKAAKIDADFRKQMKKNGF